MVGANIGGLSRSVIRRWRAGLIVAVPFALSICTAPPAQGGTALIMTVENATVAPGGSGSLDILLTNDVTSTDSATIAGFSIDLVVNSTSGITFTGATDSTGATYIFAGNSLGFFPTVTASEVQANDFAAMDGTVLAPGDPAVGLAHITFSAASDALPGMIAVALVDYRGGTSLSDANADPLEFNIVNGQITVTGAAVPEPSSIMLAATALLIGFVSFPLARRSR